MLDEDVKNIIQTSYRKYLQSLQLQARYGQKLMIAQIARTLGGVSLSQDGERFGANHVCVVEAGTGTGKTVAYLLAAIPMAKARKKKVVISTATIALQEQIVYKDLPDIAKHSGLNFTYVLAKGRGRYLCLSKLDRVLSADNQPLIPLYEELITEQDNQLFQSMMSALSEGSWNGDKDAWPDELPQESWQKVTTDHRQCTGRKCSHVRNCAFFRARDALDDADVVVANHDLVLADLALGGGAILPAPKHTFYVFDEGHHLPDKALSHFACHTRVVSTVRWLGQTEGQCKHVLETIAGLVYVQTLALPLEAHLKNTRTKLEAVQPLLLPFIAQMDRTASVVRYRFIQGEVPAELSVLAQQLHLLFAELARVLDKIVKELNRALEDEDSAVPKVDVETAFTLFGSWCTRAESNSELFLSFANSTPNPKWPVARWITLISQGDVVDFELVSSPILASHTLNEHLWEKCAGAVVTSATLTALGNFERFKLRAGTPDETNYSVVPSPFDFASSGVLHLPKQAIDATDANAHTLSIVQLLPQVLNANEASLVLFSSRKQMQEVQGLLPAAWQQKLLVQGDESKQRLLEKHRQRIDAGQGSVLFGLASFAEGLDLPGAYCQHVVIAKIPFAVPDDPIEAAMAEWIEQQGGNAFMQIAVPDAAIKLVQACGRLLRTESDRGQVTLLDRRIVSKRYGKAILNSLPPFKRDLQ
ncbi:MAG TPA: ATP-dependent DNA helicase DinG [Cellvibrionaceae bacterium]|nr:ATP-dependent DNA helicase DinG [Cellvibrionaceae bacterium]HMY38647.1 ATP-dependent DNA helicase DinG [Marinagarivorans sp.]HNG60917.1 ATP-dependent DNA helicase DinG [Cellvibrionaceae bacterium]